MYALYIEDITVNTIIKQMEEMVAKYEAKERTTLKQLNERLEILGENTTVEQLVNQTKAIHAQVYYL